MNDLSFKLDVYLTSTGLLIKNNAHKGEPVYYFTSNNGDFRRYTDEQEFVFLVVNVGLNKINIVDYKFLTVLDEARTDPTGTAWKKAAWELHKQGRDDLYTIIDNKETDWSEFQPDNLSYRWYDVGEILFEDDRYFTVITTVDQKGRATATTFMKE